MEWRSAFIQLRLAGGIIGNHQLAEIKRTTNEDQGGEQERESVKTLSTDSGRHAWGEREPTEAPCTSSKQCIWEEGEPVEALSTSEVWCAQETKQTEKALCTHGDWWEPQERQPSRAVVHSASNVPQDQEGLWGTGRGMPQTMLGESNSMSHIWRCEGSKGAEKEALAIPGQTTNHAPESAQWSLESRLEAA